MYCDKKFLVGLVCEEYSLIIKKMKITIFTSNLNRHNYLINLMSEICEELYVIQENNTIFHMVPGHYQATDLMNKYFSKVREAQSKIFNQTYIKKFKNIHILPMKAGDLNSCSLKFLNEFLKSDFYIVFGSSYIKGKLLDFLVKKNYKYSYGYFSILSGDRL